MENSWRLFFHFGEPNRFMGILEILFCFGEAHEQIMEIHIDTHVENHVDKSMNIWKIMEIHGKFMEKKA